MELSYQNLSIGETYVGFYYGMPHHTKLLIRKEVRLYTTINFFAEVGGYLGLLLGQSLLSYLVMGSEGIQIFGRKLKVYFTKQEENS